MKLIAHWNRMSALILLVSILQGCAAAALPRDRPDFENDRKRLSPLSFEYQPDECRAMARMPGRATG